MTSDILVGTNWLIHKERRQAAARALVSAHRMGAKMAEGMDLVEIEACFGGDSNVGPATVFDVGKTRVIRIEGVLVADDGLSDGMAAWFGLVKTNKIREYVEEASADKKVERILLRIDSPGGQVDGIAELAHAVESAGKPVDSFVWGMCASGAYWVAAASETIHAVPTAILGSVGAVVTIRKQRRGENSVEFVSAQTPRKRMDPFDDDDAKRAAARAEFQNLADTLGGIFVDYVREKRGDHGGKLDGSVFVGQNAIDAGYADQLGYMSAILAGNWRKRSTMSTKAEKDKDGTKEAESQVEATPPAPEPEKETASEVTPETLVSEASEADRVTAINALPGTDSQKLKAVAEGMSVAEAAKMILAEANEVDESAKEHIEAQEEHEATVDFPATHAKAVEGEDALVNDYLAMAKKHGNFVSSGVKA